MRKSSVKKAQCASVFVKSFGFEDEEFYVFCGIRCFPGIDQMKQVINRTNVFWKLERLDGGKSGNDRAGSTLITVAYIVDRLAVVKHDDVVQHVQDLK